MKKFWRILAALILAIVLFIALTSCFEENEPKTDVDLGIPDIELDTSPSDSTGTPPTAKPSKYEATLIGVTESTGTEYFKPSEGKVFLICEFEIANNSDKDLAISSLLSFSAYCDDYACQLSISAMVSAEDKIQLDGTIASGKKMKGIVGYEVPTNWRELEIHYTPDILSDSTMTFTTTHN